MYRGKIHNWQKDKKVNHIWTLASNHSSVSPVQTHACVPLSLVTLKPSLGSICSTAFMRGCAVVVSHCCYYNYLSAVWLWCVSKRVGRGVCAFLLKPHIHTHIYICIVSLMRADTHTHSSSDLISWQTWPSRRWGALDDGWFLRPVINKC